MEEDQIECTAGYAAVSEVEHCTEEGLRVLHPWELVVEQRKIEHINDLSEHECKRCSGHHCLWPDKAIEETVDDVS